jgi:hypothetical protein
MQELRCGSKKFGEVVDGHTVEVKCDSRFCGAKPGVIVLHKFDLSTGLLVETTRFKDIRRK